MRRSNGISFPRSHVLLSGASDWSTSFVMLAGLLGYQDYYIYISRLVDKDL